MTQTTDYSLLENVAIAVATIVLGVMAGFFWTYTFNVNLAMLQLDGKTYAIMQSLLNQNVRHAAFFLLFFGGGLLPLVALLVNYRHWRQLAFWLVAISAAVYILGIIIFTREVNLPLNAYTESWNPSNLPQDWTTTRDKWNQANAIRVGLSLCSFILCLFVLVLRASRSQ